MKNKIFSLHICVKELPDEDGYYQTDLGRLYYSKKDAWSKKEGTLKQYWPTHWFKELDIEKLLNQFGNHSLAKGMIMYSSNDVASNVTEFLENYDKK